MKVKKWLMEGWEVRVKTAGIGLIPTREWRKECSFGEERFRRMETEVSSALYAVLRNRKLQIVWNTSFAWQFRSVIDKVIEINGWL